jgi:hypothetical protein
MHALKVVTHKVAAILKSLDPEVQLKGIRRISGLPVKSVIITFKRRHGWSDKVGLIAIE